MQLAAEKKIQKIKTVVITEIILAVIPKSERLDRLKYLEKHSQIIRAIQEIKNCSIWEMLRLITLAVLGIVFCLIIYILIKIKTREENFIKKKLLSALPEEWQADLQALQKRWMKKKYSSFKIRKLTIKYICDMYFAAMKIKIENFYFFNRSSKKEID